MRDERWHVNDFQLLVMLLITATSVEFLIVPQLPIHFTQLAYSSQSRRLHISSSDRGTSFLIRESFVYTAMHLSSRFLVIWIIFYHSPPF